MKVAVIGAGTMGGMHADLLGTMDEVERLYVVDADPARAEEVARRAGGEPATFEEAVAAAGAIIVATPPELHRAAVETALDAGLHVLCEKPLTDSLESTIELTRRVEERGSHLEVGFQRRHDAGFKEARDAAQGRIHTIQLTAHDPLISARSPLSGPPPKVAPIFRDSSIHDFDMARWLSGQEVTEVSVEAGTRNGSRPEDPREIESAIITMRLSGGTLAVLDAAWLNPLGYDCRIELLSERTAVTAGLSPRTPALHADWTDPIESWSGYLERFEHAYRAELAAFLACCRAVRPPSSSARDGLEAMRVAVAATLSHVERRRVSLDEVAGLAKTQVA
ncbi:MAG TPA: Gfo/Idh/MocA family oxidoreductase [Candidatus Limnocylindrales bacterium]|nr:Gfo/Idh/MocA family oxidoreductase [Candidatus Limnocylindrales bacterium]